MIRLARRLSFLFFFALISGAHGADPAKGAALVADFDHSTGTTDFLAKGHPSALRIVGHGKSPTGKLDLSGGKLQGTLTVDLDAFSTGISMRDKHMKEKYLEVGKFPKATLKLSGVPVYANVASDFKVDTVPFHGLLNLHGVEKPVTGSAKVDRKGDSAHVTATFPLKLTDYGITIPSFAGITVADVVDVSVDSSVPVKPAP